MLKDNHIESAKDLEATVNERLNGFFAQGSQWQLGEIFAEWRDVGWDAFLFGGILRDLVLHGSESIPRDIDIVVANRTLRQLHKELSPYIKRETRFGGLHVAIASWKFDIWPLSETWAFTRRPNIEATFSNLPKTTFLNVEGVVAELPNGKSKSRTYEWGFIQAVRSKILDINLEENHYPELAAARAILTARRLKFSMSDRLARYVLHTVEISGVDALIDAQKGHYSDVLLKSDDIGIAIVELKSHNRRRVAQV